MPASNELRLFLSSTFIDFQAERDFLAKKVFPALRNLCRERGVEFTEIDLRWGLTDEDAERGRIIGTCLQEIENCRPFFIGLLGERYGWVPPIEELAKNSELRKDHPWIEAAISAGQSVTEMEFRHGFLNNDQVGTKPLVYFRLPPDTVEKDARMTRLKDEVSARLGEIPVFGAPAELAALLEKDLTAMIERNWPATEKQTWLDEERAGHAAFAQSRRKGYVANPSVMDSLNDHLGRPEPVLVVTGESGSGKSSLLAYWAESLRQADPNLFVIEHYIGVTAASTDPDTLMRRIVEEIKERIHSEDPVPQSAAELEQSFPSWLGRITREQMLILVDAINQLNTDGRFMAWLPDHLQSNVRWVISSTQSEALDRLRDRGKLLDLDLPEIAVNPITLPERRRVLRTFLAGYQKKLDRKQEEKIVRSKKSASPLFLRTLLEELRLQGKHEALDGSISHYIASSDIPDLFSRILERLERDYGAEEVQILLIRIWAAPHGLSESEIIESSNLDRVSLSLLLHAFDFHLIRVKGRLSFFHDHLRTAVEGRYIETMPKKQKAWLELAYYFRSADASPIKALSLPWLLNKAGEWGSLKKSLLDISLMPFLTEGSRSYDLLGYWNTLEKLEANVSTPNGVQRHWNIDVVAEYESALTLHSDILDVSKECNIRYALALFFRNAGWYEGAISNAGRSLSICEGRAASSDDPLSEDPIGPTVVTNSLLPISSRDTRESCCASDIGECKPRRTLSTICLELGKAYLDKADLTRASEVLQKAMRILDRDWSPDVPGGPMSVPFTGLRADGFDLRRINVRNEYARLLKDLGKYADAESVSRVTLKAATERFGTTNFATQNEMRQLADILTREGKFEEAESLHRKVIKSVEASLGPESLDVAYYLNEFVQFLMRKSFRRENESSNNIQPEEEGDYHEGQKLLERAVGIIESRLGEMHPDLGNLINNLASLHSQNGNWEKAEPLFLRTLAISDMAFGPEHPSTSLSINNYAGQLFRLGKYEQAESAYRRALDIRHKVLGEDNPETAVSYNNLANVLRRQGKYEEAEKCYGQALRIKLSILGPLHVDTSRTLEGFGRFMRIKGDFAASEDLFSRSYTAKRNSLGSQHHDTIFIALALWRTSGAGIESRLFPK